MTPQTRFRSFAGAPAPVVKRRALLGLALATFVTAGCDKFLPESKTPFNGVDITGSDLGPDFRLTDHNGKERSLADFRGKVVTLFFGYTHCPDVCPTTLSDMAQAGFPKSASLNIDTGAHRTFIDNVRIGRGEVYSKFLVAVARWIKHGTREFDRSPTYAEDLQTLLKYKDVAEFAEKALGAGKGLKRVPVGAAIARAKLAAVPDVSLKRFGEVFAKGFADGPHESAAVALRNYCLQLSDRNMAGRTVDRELFLKAQNALYYFCRSRRLTVIKGVASEMYPMKKSK